jgi:hypothetical protein
MLNSPFFLIARQSSNKIQFWEPAGFGLKCHQFAGKKTNFFLTNETSYFDFGGDL